MNRMMRSFLAFGAAIVLTGSSSAAYVVEKSAVCPTWSGALPGEWTMDYAAATNAATQTGRPVFVLTTGMWWCPHCQGIEKNILTQPAWSNFVKEVGCYLVALDFPYRGTVSAAEAYKTADFDLRTQRPG